MIKIGKTNESAVALAKAFKSGNEEEMTKAWELFTNEMKESYEEAVASNDANIMAQRGFRQLTSKEVAFYEKFIESAKSSNPKQAFTTLLADNPEFMPETIVEEVFKDLVEEHALLSKINFRSVKYLTTWLLNDHATQTAVWGEITDEIAKEITSAFKSINVNQCKLSAFAVIEKGMLDLGPVFIDAYIRACLKEALALGLEDAIIDGTGKNMPIGLDRNIGAGVSVTDGVYPLKTAEVVTAFTPESYGALLGKLAKKENGKRRKFGLVTLICNQVDYLTKIMPATTVLNADGTYKNNLFPFPTEVIISNVVDDGKAVLALLPEYFMGIGGSKDGVIEYSDEYKFIEDQRAYKIKMYGTGRAEDNTSALLLDISKLDPAYITVKQITETATV